MRLALTLALVLAATATSRQGCGGGVQPPAYEPCAGKSCGAACTACDPKDPSCVETAVVKACDPFGACVPLASGLCDSTRAACTGKACGDVCTVDPPCRNAMPPCMLPSLIGHCDPTGTCVAGIPPPDFCAPCAGKACGASCDPCGGLCMHPYASACDAAGTCVPVPVSCK